MTVSMNDLPDAGCASFTSDDVMRALREILISPRFIKAPRMRHLLSFLMEKKLGGLEWQLSEYAIGLEVFRRDARSYDTGLDPVVRVQVGRLRERLTAYYATARAAVAVQISIPVGSYVPLLRPAGQLLPGLPRGTLQLAPLRNLAWEHRSNAFVCGLDEELGSRLFHVFGSALLLRDTSPAAPPAGGEHGPAHRLEGSIRVEREHVRACMRLIDAGAGHIAWQSQFDCNGVLDISLQERLASAICDGLRPYLTPAGP